MARAVGRKKHKKMTRLAILVECREEFCGLCRMIDRVPDKLRKCEILFCKFFKRELVPAFNSNIAERCSDCHMAERCAHGERI